MNYKKDDKVNEELKKLLKEEQESFEEASLAKAFDKAISKRVTKP